MKTSRQVLTPKEIEKLAKHAVKFAGSYRKLGDALGVSYQTVVNWTKGFHPSDAKFNELMDYVEFAKTQEKKT